MRHESDFHIRTCHGDDRTSGMFIGLYLILLAFFIVLASISSPQSIRTLEAVEGVQTAFDAPETGVEGTAPARDREQPEEIGADNYLDGVQDLFLAELGIEGRFAGERGHVLEIAFPLEYFFEADSLEVRRNRHTLLSQLAAMARTETRGRQNDITFLFGTGMEPITAEITESQDTALRRAGALARLLGEFGLSPGRYTTGMIPGDPAQIIAIFKSDPASASPGSAVQTP